MSVSAAEVSVTTSATLLASHPISTKSAEIGRDIVVVVNNISAGSIYVGGSAVTTAQGLTQAAAITQSYVLQPGDSLYAIAGSTLLVRVLRNGQ